MGKLNMWSSGFCSFGALTHFFILNNIGWGCFFAVFAIINLVVGVLNE
jgi:hypothetical protein